MTRSLLLGFNSVEEWLGELGELGERRTAVEAAKRPHVGAEIGVRIRSRLHDLIPVSRWDAFFVPKPPRGTPPGSETTLGGPPRHSRWMDRFEGGETHECGWLGHL